MQLERLYCDEKGSRERENEETLFISNRVFTPEVMGKRKECAEENILRSTHHRNSRLEPISYVAITTWNGEASKVLRLWLERFGFFNDFHSFWSNVHLVMCFS